VTPLLRPDHTLVLWLGEVWSVIGNIVTCSGRTHSGLADTKRKPAKTNRNEFSACLFVSEKSMCVHTSAGLIQMQWDSSQCGKTYFVFDTEIFYNEPVDLCYDLSKHPSFLLPNLGLLQKHVILTDPGFIAITTSICFSVGVCDIWLD